MVLRATSFVRAADVRAIPFDLVTLAHDERRLRRKLLTLVHGDEVLVDLPQPVTFESHDALVLEDGRLAEIIAAEEALYEVRGRDAAHLMQLCWHLGNRHLPAQIASDGAAAPSRVVIKRDAIIRTMLLGLGATVQEISEPFSPVYGAYHDHGSHNHALLNR